MPYVCRDAQGAVTSLHRDALAGTATEWLAGDDAQVLGFLGRSAAGFQQLDADFIRVLEDLIDVLIRRRVINVTDLPSAAQHKLYSRKDHRAPTALTELNLLGDAPGAGSDGLAGAAPIG